MSAIRLPDARRWSLTARMTLFFGSAIALIVICVSTMMYAELVHQLREKEEVELLEDLHVQQEVLLELAGKSPPTRWQHEWREQQNEIGEFGWQLLRPDGALAAAGGNAPASMGKPGQAGPIGRFYRVAPATQAGGAYLVMDARFTGGQGALVLRGILEVSQDEQVLRRYLKKLLSVTMLAVVASVGIGWALVRRGMAPLRAISAQIGRMNAERLHTRIAQEVWPAELRALAETFDALMARIERSFEQLAQFSSDLAHEFRSPINNLVAAASVTLGRARSAEEYQETLEVVVEEGARLSRMVSSMLFLARADNAKQVVQMEALSTEIEFQKLLDFFGIVAEEQGVALEAAGAVCLYADPLLLRQAMSNLLANALRYTGRGGAVRLSACERDDVVLLAVADSGAGIAAEHLPFLFDRFYRADAARSAPDSAGLGLAVVRSIVELHSGTIRVQSRLGEGTVFEIRLPKNTGNLSR